MCYKQMDGMDWTAWPLIVALQDVDDPELVAELVLAVRDRVKRR
jgi:hypothetical protein